ncbi:MAG: tetratricopeptide repeat protein [bacterium]
MSKYLVSVVAAVGVAMMTGCASLQVTERAPAVAAPPLQPEVQKKADLMYEVLAGEIAGKRGQLEQAAQHYENASEIRGDAGLAERSTRIALFANDWPRALKAVQRWITLDLDNVDARQIAGLLYVETEQPEKAVEQFSWILDNAKDQKPELVAHLSQSIAKEGVTPSTLKVFDLLRRKYPDSLEAQLAYSKLALRARKFEEALVAADRGLLIDPENTTGHVLRNRILLNMGKSDIALENMQRLAEKHPHDAEVHLDYARMLVQAKRYTEALDEFVTVMSLVPEDKNLTYSTALLQVELGKYPEAEKNLKKLVHSKTHRDAAAFYLGRIKAAQKEWAKGMAWYLKVGEGEYYYDAQASAAQMLANLGQIDHARKLLQKLRNETSEEPVKIRLLLAEGQILRDADQLRQGIAFYTEGLKQYPGNIDLLYARGMMAEDIDRLDMLEADMKAILKKEPDNSTALNALGYTLADKTERYEEALEYIKKALALKPDDPAVLDSMGWVQYRLGHFDKAVAYLQKAHNQLDDPEISYHLGQVLWAAGQQSAALETVKEALKGAPDDSRLQKLLRQFSR